MLGDPNYLEAIARFKELWSRVAQLDLAEPAAMTLATASAEGLPTARVVLLRRFDERGFVFYTNQKSRKGQELEANPSVAICLYWDAIGEQVRVEGRAAHLSDAENDAYWDSRSRMSQIASSVSKQSERLDDYQAYVAEVNQLETKLDGRAVPRPAHWIGYLVVPKRIEFWSSRDARMHVRHVYEQQESGWTRSMLYP